MKEETELETERPRQGFPQVLLNETSKDFSKQCVALGGKGREGKSVSEDGGSVETLVIRYKDAMS